MRRAAAVIRHISVSKILLLVAIGVIVYVALSGAARKRRRHDESRTAELMVPCAHCGVNFPRSEGVEAGGRFYCSDAHRRLGSG